MLKKFLPKILIALSLLFPSLGFSEPGGDLNLNNKASLVSRDGHNLVLGTEGDDDVVFIQNNATTFSIDGTTGAIAFTGTLTPLLPNNTYLKARNAADSADLDVLKVDTSNQTTLNTAAGTNFNVMVDGTIEVQLGNDVLNFTGTTPQMSSAGYIQLAVAADQNRRFTFDAASDTAMTLQFGDAGTTAAQTFSLTASTADADDDSGLFLNGGGSTSNARGAGILLYGNEATGGNAGYLEISSGSIAGADVIVLSRELFRVSDYLGNPNFTVDTTTSVATFAGAIQNTSTIQSTSTTDLGWSAVNAANQACNTTCTSACVFGMNTGALGNFVGCADATADTCICAGAS